MKTLTLKLDAIEYLFVEPEEDLFAEHEYDVLGMSGMAWVSKQIGPRWRYKREYILVDHPRMDRSVAPG